MKESQVEKQKADLAGIKWYGINKEMVENINKLIYKGILVKELFSSSLFIPHALISVII